MFKRRAEIARTEVAEIMMTDHGHLFPHTTAYWRFRTFQRMLTEQGALAYQECSDDWVPEVY